jgi:acyl-CoA thioester hydrolase
MMLIFFNLFSPCGVVQVLPISSTGCRNDALGAGLLNSPSMDNWRKQSPMPAIYQHRLIVPNDAIDGQGHVNNLEYVRWMQEAAIAHSDAQGWSAERYQQFGAGWVVRTHKIEYLQAAFAGDEITVYTWVSNFRKIRSLRKYKIVRTTDRATLAVAETDWAFIAHDRRVPRRIPPEVAEAFLVVPEEDEP